MVESYKGLPNSNQMEQTADTPKKMDESQKHHASCGKKEAGDSGVHTL